MKMQHFIKLTFFWATVAAISILSVATAMGQCASLKFRVEHTSGTETVGCTDVTVTSDGSVGSTFPWGGCYYGPYQVGVANVYGSYTYTFSVPIQGVTIDAIALEHWIGTGIDEMVIDVNGTFYPLTSAGTADGCLPFQPAVIWPPGTLRGPVGGDGSAKDIFIPGPIYSIKVADVVQGIPAGFTYSLYICCPDCSGTNAGIINANDFEACIGGPAEVPPATQVVLDADDILQYILFTDPSNPNTSILAGSNTPSFNFNPSTMATGITYYIAAIAGNELNGNVDSSDPCWDISNIIEVKWWPEPTVAFTSDAECLHADGSYDINISFTGNPPFHLTGQVVLGGNVIATFDDTYSFFSEILMVYLPPTTPSGSLTIEALSLSDAHCSCD